MGRILLGFSMAVIPLDTLCGTREVAHYLRISQMHALRLLRSGRIPGQFLHGRWYARASELERHRVRASEVCS